LDSGHYVFAESDWTVHTPFLVKAWVNDKLFAEEIIDTVGATKTVTLGEDPNVITVSKLGLIGTGYEAPVWQDIVWFNHKYFYLRESGVDKALSNPYPIGDGITAEVGEVSIEQLRGTYAFYWYGDEIDEHVFNRYWKDEGDPQPYTPDFGWIKFAHNNWGWIDRSDTFTARFEPVPPVLLPEQEDAHHQPRYCVTEYLEQVVHAQRPTMPSWLPNSADIIITENNEMRLYLPMGSMNALVNLRVSTDLADTYVWAPVLGNFKITGFNDFGDVYEEKQWTITVKQLENATVPVSGTIWFTVKPSTLEVGVNPPTIGVQLGYNMEQTFTFNILNLAVQDKTDFSIMATVTNSLGQVTDEKTVYGTAMPRSGTVTYLVLYLTDHKDRTPVSGIYVSVTYDSQSKIGMSQAGSVAFDFGSTAPYVEIVTQETKLYQSATASKQLSVGSNSLTIELLKHGETPDGDWLWIVIIAGVLAAGFITVFTLKKKGKIW